MAENRLRHSTSTIGLLVSFVDMDQHQANTNY